MVMGTVGSCGHPDPCEVTLGRSAVRWSLSGWLLASVVLIACAIDGRSVGVLEAEAETGGTLSGSGGVPPGVGAAGRPTGAGGEGAVRASSREGGVTSPVTEAEASTLWLNVTRAGEGRVISEPPGIDCPSVCRAPFRFDAEVRLLAEPAENWMIGDWAAEGCDGPADGCISRPASDQASTERAVEVTFFPLRHNLIFISSESFPPDLGGAAPYDLACNRLASAAGINTATSDGYIAALSESTSSFVSRLRPNVRGWVRMDGKAFGDSLDSMLEGGPVYHPILYDEHGEIAEGSAFTGTARDGTADLTCSNWTVAESGSTLNPATFVNRSRAGRAGPGRWLIEGYGGCDADEPGRLICMGNTQTLPLELTPAAGKRIWVTSTTLTLGAESPDEKCAAEKPSGVQRAAALIAYTNRSGRDVIDPAASYVRVDGQLVGTGEQIIRVAADSTRTSRLEANIWLTDTATYSLLGLVGSIWTGATDLSSRGTIDTTCGDWTNARLTGINGSTEESSFEFWSLGFPDSCTSAARLFCVEL